MPYTAIVQNQTNQIVSFYDSTTTSQSSFGGDWANPALFTHMPVPEGIDIAFIRLMPDPETGALTFMEVPDRQTRLLTALREERNARLDKSDWSQMADVALSEEQKEAWRTYRQALRDLPATTEDLANPVWPEKP